MKRNGRRRKVSASIGPKLLSQVDRFFSNDLRSIATELLLNARRAGASRVVVTTDPDDRTITVSDDGRGLGSDRAEVLLTLGASSGDEATEVDERPAGMGFAALAHRGATVHSRDWRMIVTPQAFRGDGEVVVDTGRQWRRGMAVTFEHAGCRDAHGRKTVRDVFGETAAAMPFTTMVDGRAVSRHRPTDLLVDGRGNRIADGILSRIVGDCSIAVGRFEDGQRAATNRPSHDRRSLADWLTVTADLFGVAVPLGAEEAASLHPALSQRAEGELLIRSGPSASDWQRRSPAYVVVVEALGSETLVARLPDRRALVETEGLSAVGTAIAELIARLAAEAPRNGVVPDAPLRRLAGDLGIRMPPAQVVARVPRGRSANTTSGFAGHGPTPDAEEVPPRIVIDNGVTTYRDPKLPRDGRLVRLPPFGPVFSMLLKSVEAHAVAGLVDRIVEVDVDVPGVDVASGADLVIDGAVTPVVRNGRFDDEAIAWTWADSGRDPGPALAGSITLAITTSAGRTIKAPLAFAAVECGGRVETQGIVLTAGAEIATVVEALVNASPWYDARRDEGWRSQLERFRDEAREVLRGKTQATESYAAAKAIDLARLLLSGAHARNLARIAITFDRDGAHATATTTADRHASRFVARETGSEQPP